MKLSTHQADNNFNTSTLQQTNTKKLVLFDFDGTITAKDTLIEFVRFYRGKNQYFFGMVMLAPILALYATRLIPNWKAKQYFLSRYFKGEKISEFNIRCQKFSTGILPSLIRPQALKAIQAYRNENNVTLAVVTASAENWVKPWCEQHGLICLATKLEVKEGMITGKFSGKNCYGDEKVCRIREYFQLPEYTEITAYGDSSGDKQMLELAHNRFYKPFRNKQLTVDN